MTVYLPQPGEPTVEKKIPRWLVLPGDFGKRGVSGGMTPFKLFEAGSDLRQGDDPPLIAEDLGLVKEWCIAASQVKNLMNR